MAAVAGRGTVALTVRAPDGHVPQARGGGARALWKGHRDTEICSGSSLPKRQSWETTFAACGGEGGGREEGGRERRGGSGCRGAGRRGWGGGSPAPPPLARPSASPPSLRSALPPRAPDAQTARFQTLKCQITLLRWQEAACGSVTAEFSLSIM